MWPIHSPTQGARYGFLSILAALLWLPAVCAAEAQPAGKHAQFLNPDAPAEVDAVPVSLSNADQEGDAVLAADIAVAQDK